MQQERKSPWWITILKLLLPLMIGVAILLYIYKDMEMDRIVDLLLNETNIVVLCLSFPFVLLANYIRAFRWRLFITPLGYKPSYRLLALSVFGNYGVNLLLPRLGEVWRSGVVSKYTPMPMSQNLGTLIADRIYDTITVGLMALLSVAITPHFYLDLWSNELHYDPAQLLASGTLLLYLAGGVAVVALLAWLMRRTAIMQRVAAFVKGIIDGLKSLWAMESRWRMILYTLLIWGLYYCYFYTAFFAFDFSSSVTPSQALALFAITSISVILPVQGAIGPWHYAAIIGMVALGIGREDAAAFALIVHTVQTLFIALVGLLAVLAISLLYSSKQTAEPTAEQNEEV